MTKPIGKLGLVKESHLPSVEIDKHRLVGAALPGTAVAPTQADWTGGIPDPTLGMLGNDAYSDCGPAATEHGRMFKGVLGTVNGVAKWQSGFRPPHVTYTLWMYSHYLQSIGETLAQDPGVENATWLLYMYNVTKVSPGADTLAFAEWPLTTDPNQLLLDAAAFRGMLTAVALDDQYSAEFSQGVPFGTLSTTPDQNYGHDMWLVGYEPGLMNYCTWGTVHGATDAWDAACVIERWATLTKEDADRTGVDWASLTAALDAETDAHPILSGIDFSQVTQETFLQKLETHLSELWKHL